MNYVQSVAKKGLKAHTWLGLVASALMYIVCLSGTIAVFHQEFERWEQPQIPEVEDFTKEQVSRAYAAFDAQYPEDTDHMHIVFPSSGIPRVVMENDHVAHFVDAQGTLGETEASAWTKMLVDLHLYLHLPKTFGMILVSAFGALLCAFVLSGLIAHPRIIKDAFRFRTGGSGLQQNIDLHNRFSVWATPFHLMIGVTGAYFGLAGVFIVVVSSAFYGGDRQAVVDKVFAPEPELHSPVIMPDIAKAIDYVQQHDPDGQLIFLTVHEPRTEGQFIEVYVKQPRRLIYSENYRFDAEGELIERVGYRDGAIGSQVIYSMYRLHFGDFGGLLSKLLYFVLGLMLTVIAATGMNIWLAKRKTRDWINVLWPAWVWGVPSGLAVSALSALFAPDVSGWTLWLTACGILIAACKTIDEQALKHKLRLLLAFSIAVLLLGYVCIHGRDAFSFASLQVNVPLGLFSMMLLFSCLWEKARNNENEEKRQFIIANENRLQ